MRICIPFLLLFSPAITLAQHGQLLRNDDILWAAEVESFVCFDAYAEQQAPGFLEAMPLKVVQEETFNPHPTPFTKELFELMAQGRWPAFADAALSRPLQEEALRAYLAPADTITVFDPETYEEKVVIVYAERLGSSPVFAVRQLWSFNGRTNSLEIQALAIAPTWNAGGPHEPDYRPLAWFKLPPADKKLFRMDSGQLPYASFVKLNVPEKSMRVLKGDGTPLKAILFGRMQGGRMKGYDGEGRQIPPAQAPAIFSSADTIITFDPETYEETIDVVRRDFSPEDVGAYRLKQAWFFSPARGRLQCRAEAVAPNIAVTDEYGQLKYLQPLFYWKRE